MNKFDELAIRDNDIHKTILCLIALIPVIMLVGYVASKFLIWLSPIFWGWLIG